MRRILLSMFTATSLLLFIAVNALSYVYAQKESTVSVFEETCDDTEESESEENKSKELEDDDAQVLIGRNLYLISYKQVRQTNTTFIFQEGNQPEITSPPPQF